MNPLKKITLVLNLLIVLSAFFMFRTAYSQNLNLDSLQDGKKYKIVLFDDREIIGTLKNSDSVYINIADKDGLYRVRKEDVFFISRILYPTKYNTMISVGGGLSFLTGDYNEYYYYSGQKSMVGYNAALKIDFPIAENKTIGFEASYNRFKQDGYSSYSTVYDPTFMNFYSFKIDFRIGSFEKFFYYGVFGVGMNLTRYSESRSTYYSTYDSTLSLYVNPAFSKTNAVLGLGGGAGYKFNNKFGIYAEMEYNFITSSPFIFWGSGYFPLKVGLIYFIY